MKQQETQITLNREILKAFDSIRAEEIYNSCKIIELDSKKVGVLANKNINLSNNDRDKIKQCIASVYGNVSVVKLADKKEFFEPSNSSKKIPSPAVISLWQSVKKELNTYYDEAKINSWFESEYIKISEKDNELILLPTSSEFCLKYIHDNYSHRLENIAKEKDISIKLKFNTGIVELPFKRIPPEKIEHLINSNLEEKHDKSNKKAN